MMQNSNLDLPATVAAYVPSELLVRTAQHVGLTHRNASSDVSKVVPLILRELVDHVSVPSLSARLIAVLETISDEAISMLLKALSSGHQQEAVDAGSTLIIDAIGEPAANFLVGTVAKQLRTTRDASASMVCLLTPAVFFALADIRRYFALNPTEFGALFAAQAENIATEAKSVNERQSNRMPLKSQRVKTFFAQHADRATSTSATNTHHAIPLDHDVASMRVPGNFGLVTAALVVSLMLLGTLAVNTARNEMKLVEKGTPNQSVSATPAPLKISAITPRSTIPMETGEKMQNVSTSEMLPAPQAVRVEVIERLDHKTSAPDRSIADARPAVGSGTAVAHFPTASITTPSAPETGTHTPKESDTSPTELRVLASLPSNGAKPRVANVEVEIIKAAPTELAVTEDKANSEQVQPHPVTITTGTLVSDSAAKRRLGELKACRAAARNATASGALNFDAASKDIETLDSPEMAKLITAIKACASVRVRIEGHTDADGTPERNAVLSTRRAKALFDLFSRSGIDADRMSFEGRGSTKPLASNASDEDKQRNRRIELFFE